MSGDQVTVTVSDDHMGGIDAVADRLRGAGMRVDQVLPVTGVITGSAPRDRHTALAGVAGVAGVEPSTDFTLPPESDPR